MRVMMTVMRGVIQDLRKYEIQQIVAANIKMCPWVVGTQVK